jgi:2-keto-4-pentenoate hydratase
MGSRRTQDAKGASQYPREVADAIAFLHSMLELVDARRWSQVTDYFAGATLGIAGEILGPKKEPEAKAIEDARNAIDSAGAFLEEFPHTDHIPAAVLKGAVAMIETTLRASQEMPHPSALEALQ